MDIVRDALGTLGQLGKTPGISRTSSMTWDSRSRILLSATASMYRQAGRAFVPLLRNNVNVRKSLFAGRTALLTARTLATVPESGPAVTATNRTCPG